MAKIGIAWGKKPALILLIALVIIFSILFSIQNKKTMEPINKKINSIEMLQIADALYRNGNYAEAIAQFQEVHNQDQKNYLANIGLGFSYMQLGIYDEAIKTFEKTFRTGYVDFRAFYGLGLAYYNKEDYSKAYLTFKQAYELNPNNEAVVSYLTNAYNTIGLYDEAIKIAADKLRMNVNNGHYYRKIAIAHFLKNDLNTALKNSQKAVQLDPNYAPNHFILATVYLSLGQKQNSLEEFNNALALRKSNVFYEGASLSYSLLGDMENSGKNSHLATFYTKNGLSLSLLGFSLLNIGEYGKAIAEFNSAISIAPEYYLPYKGLGKVYMALGERERAIQNFEKAWELNKFDREIKSYLQTNKTGGEGKI